MAIENSIQSLMELGFTRLEAEIYTYLLQHSPATGYRTAQAIGKPVANTYKAIQTLEQKGALLIDDSDKKLCRAVPSEELLSQLQRQFTQRKSAAESSLKELNVSEGDDRIYQLHTSKQVLERCRRMLAGCREVAVVDAFPRILNTLKPDIDAASRRGIRVAVGAYAPVDLTGVHLFERPHGDRIMERWPGQWVRIVTDGEEYLLALLDTRLKEVLQSLWSSSPYLSWVQYKTLMSELILVNWRRELETAASLEELRSVLETSSGVFTVEVPGYQRLMERFGGVKKEGDDQ